MKGMANIPGVREDGFQKFAIGFEKIKFENFENFENAFSTPRRNLSHFLTLPSDNPCFEVFFENFFVHENSNLDF